MHPSTVRSSRMDACEKQLIAVTSKGDVRSLALAIGRPKVLALWRYLRPDNRPSYSCRFKGDGNPRASRG